MTQDEDKQKKKHKTIYVGHHHTQTSTNNINKTWALLETTGGKDEPNIGNTVHVWFNKAYFCFQTGLYVCVHNSARCLF